MPFQSGYAGERYERRKDSAGGDGPAAKDDKMKAVSKVVSSKAVGKDAKGKGKEEIPEPEEIPKTPSQLALEYAEYRAMLRKNRFKRRWPEVTKVEIKTRKWRPPPPPKKLPRLFIELPEVQTRRWVPPYRRRRRPRPKPQRIPAEEITKPLYEYSKLRKIYHNFVQVDRNKMMLQGHTGCNSKKYSSTACESQTGAIAVMCKALLEEKNPGQLMKWNVDDVIDQGDKYYKQCMLSMKCYKGKPSLELNQLLTSFFFHDTRYTVKMVELDRGLLAKHPDNIQTEPDLMAMMEKRSGQNYSLVLTVGDRHFLIWGHPPSPESGSQAKTICYIFDPHMLNDQGQPNKLYGGGAFLRYAGINSFVLDFLSNYGDLDSAKRGTPKPSIALTDIEIVQREPLTRIPDYQLDMKALPIHCKSEWESMNYNALIEKKQHGEYVIGSLSMVRLATSRGTAKKKVGEFYQRPPKESPPQLPVAPEKAPAGPTQDQIMQMRGENFFLYCPRPDGHSYGRDDMLPRPRSETVFHSPVEIANVNFHSQFHQLDVGKWILRSTRHFASQRYQAYKYNTGLACCICALGMLRRLRARAWNEDTVDECLDVGSNFFRESLLERRGPMRRLTIGEHKETFYIRNGEYKHKERGIAVWGKLISGSPTVLDLCRGIESFFKESDAGVLQIPGEYETAIWQEDGKYYVFHPWPTDRYGHKVGLRDGGKACLLCYGRISRLCEHFLENASDMKRKPFSISDVYVTENKDIPEPVAEFKSVAPNRWVIQGRFHEGDVRFPEEHRNRQATPASIAAIAIAHIQDPSTWTSDNIDEALVRGDILYQQTIEALEAAGISQTTSNKEDDEDVEEEQAPTGTLAAADVLTKFMVSEYDCISTEVMDSLYTGSLKPEPGSGVMTLKDSLRQLFKDYTHAVVTARGGSTAIWKHEDTLYMFDPHGCDENGYPSDEPMAAACLLRIKGPVEELVDAIESNLAPGTDDSFNVSPVEVTANKINYEIGAPETNVESKAFEWIRPGTAAIMMGPRGENSAIGKSAKKAGVPEEDYAGRTIALPAAAAFTAAAAAVPPPHMHQDHMYNFLDAGAEYYLNHIKKTGKKEITPEDLTQKFEMGANTFSITLGEPMTYPLRLPDPPSGEEAGEEEAEKEELGEEEEEEKEPPIKEIKGALYKMMTKPNSLALLVGDYHQLGVWCDAGGQVVAFDPAPTLPKGIITVNRIKKGDEIRIQRIKDLAREMAGEGGLEEAEDEEAGGEGEAQPEPEPEFVPPESCPALMVFASPNEFIDKLASQGPLDNKQRLAPYKLYPVTVTNELTSLLKEKRPNPNKKDEEDADDEEEADVPVEPLEDAAMGKYFNRLGRACASLRGRVAQGEAYFMEKPNRDNQDAANSVMGIVVDHIEPYIYWKPELLDAILKYGDRLYTMSLPKASSVPHISPGDVSREFHVTNFNVKLDVNPGAVTGDIKAGETGAVLNLKRGIKQFFETNKHGVICAKEYCVGIWKGADDKAVCLWDPHAVGPRGRSSPGGAASIVLFSSVDDLADTIKSNLEGLARGGSNSYTITSVKVFWEISKIPAGVTAQGTVPDEGYEWKVLTAYVETARGRTILRGSRPPDLVKFRRDCLLQSACGAIVGACMSHIRRPHLWTRKTVDEIVSVACQLFSASLGTLGYEFRPGEDVLLPLQVLKRFILGVNYVLYDLESIFTGKLEQTSPAEMSVRCALEQFFEAHTHGILWSVPHAVAVWRVAGAPPFYMMEPHSCGACGLRVEAQEEGAACVLTFTSAKLMAFAYLQNIPVTERPKHYFILYAMSVTVQPIKKLGGVDPPLVRAPPGAKLVPATSKVYVDGSKRRAREEDRKHPPGSATCLDAQRASENRDKEQNVLKGQRNTSGWLVLNDGSQFLSAQHSMACRKFPYASRGNQALACCVMAVAMSRVEDVCRWCSSTLDQILESGDQLYQDSYLHFKPKNTKILSIGQILRKFYTPGNCVCRVQVYKPRQEGSVANDLQPQLEQFFREEKAGVFVTGDGDVSVALFRTPRGFYMFDPADRDRYGRAVAPPCRGRARACFSQYPNVKMLSEKLGPNIPPVLKEPSIKGSNATPKGSPVNVKVIESEAEKEVRFEEPASFAIYGMDVTSLRRPNQHEK